MRRVCIEDSAGSREGWFHAWSIDFDKFSSGPGQFPCAIIERDDGGVEVVYAEHVTFLTPYGAEEV